MTDNAPQNKDTEKFLFHINIFDEDVIEEEIEEPPSPPPTFSEEELAAARKSGYEKGKADGFAEASKTEQKSREQLVANVLQSIEDQTSILFTQEQGRATLYEEEVTALCLETFKKLFPVYNEKHGFEELKDCIAEILQKQQNQAEIKIQVHPAVTDAIKKLVKELGNEGIATKFRVEGDENLSDGACSMSWSDGGARRDPEILAEQIKALMQQTLAGSATNSHDRGKGSSSEPKDTQALPPPRSRTLTPSRYKPKTRPMTRIQVEKPDE